jgi:predicted transposase YdaD
VLLRPAADGPELTGVLEKAFPGEPPYDVFRYRVVRVWQIPVEGLLTGGLGLVALAPISSLGGIEVAGVIRRMAGRIEQEANFEEAGAIWTATGILMGLRYPRTAIAQLLSGVRNMKESVFYQSIVEEGWLRGAQDMVLRVGRGRLGPPDAETEARIRSIEDVGRLERMAERLWQVSDWQQLLAVN